MESENIKLIVKSPNQSVKDFPIECRPDWPVRVLKQRLSMVYPSKPVRVYLPVVYVMTYHYLIVYCLLGVKWNIMD